MQAVRYYVACRVGCSVVLSVWKSHMDSMVRVPKHPKLGKLMAQTLNAAQKAILLHILGGPGRSAWKP